MSQALPNLLIGASNFFILALLIRQTAGNLADASRWLWAGLFVLTISGILNISIGIARILTGAV